MNTGRISELQRQGFTAGQAAEILKRERANDSPAASTIPDVFSPDHPCQLAPLEIPTMSSSNGTALRNGHGKSGVEAQIVPPSQKSIREMVEEAIGILGIDLRKELTMEHRQAIARTAGLELGQVKGAIERIRTTGGIKTRTRPGARRRAQPAAEAQPAPTPASIPAAPEPTSLGANGTAKALALELAGEMLQYSRRVDEEKCADLLLTAGQLLAKVL